MIRSGSDLISLSQSRVSHVRVRTVHSVLAAFVLGRWVHAYISLSSRTCRGTSSKLTHDDSHHTQAKGAPREQTRSITSRPAPEISAAATAAAAAAARPDSIGVCSGGRRRRRRGLLQRLGDPCRPWQVTFHTDTFTDTFTDTVADGRGGAGEVWHAAGGSRTHLGAQGTADPRLTRGRREDPAIRRREARSGPTGAPHRTWARSSTAPRRCGSSSSSSLSAVSVSASAPAAVSVI